MGQLALLRTLQAFIVSKKEDDGCSIRELENLNWLRGSFCISGLEYASEDDVKIANMQQKRLTELHLKWNDSVSYDDDACKKAYSVLIHLCPDYASLEELQISYYPGSDWPRWMQSKALSQLVSVTLLSCGNKEIIGLEALPSLKYLTFIDMNKVTDIAFKALRQFPNIMDLAYADSDEIRFPRLETLTIDGMLNLRSFTGLDIHDCPYLQKICVKRCPNLKTPYFLSYLRSLTYLEISHCKSWEKLPYAQLPESVNTLVINKCPLLKKRCSGENGEDWKRIQHVPNIWIDMKGFGKENKHTDPDDSDEETDHYSNDSDDSDKESNA